MSCIYAISDSDVCSYPVRDLAFEAAKQAYDSNCEPDLDVDLDIPACKCPANEPLCEAIREKMGTYSVDETYSLLAWKRAGEKIAALEKSVFDLTDAETKRLGVGPKTNHFIYEWIDDEKICQGAAARSSDPEERRMWAESVWEVALGNAVDLGCKAPIVVITAITTLQHALSKKCDAEQIETLTSFAYEAQEYLDHDVEDIPVEDDSVDMIRECLEHMDALDMVNVMFSTILKFPSKNANFKLTPKLALCVEYWKTILEP
jgi:hypothetical protein